MTKNREDHPVDRPEHLLDYLDGVLEAEERDRLEVHLEACPRCRAEVAQQRSVRGLLANHRLVDPPPDLPASVFTSIQADRLQRESAIPRRTAGRGGMRDWLERHRLRPQVLVPLAAALLLVAVGVGSVSSELLDDEREAVEDAFSTAADEAAPEATIDAGVRSEEKAPGQSGSGGEDVAEDGTLEDGTLEERSELPAIEQEEGDAQGGSTGTGGQAASEDGPSADSAAVTARPGQAVNLLYGSAAGTLSEDSRPAGLFSTAGSAEPADPMPAPLAGGNALSYLLWLDSPQVQALLTHTWSMGFHPEISIIDIADLPAEMRLQAERTGVYEVDDSGLLRWRAGSGTVDEHVDAGRVLVMIRLPLP